MFCVLPSLLAEMAGYLPYEKLNARMDILKDNQGSFLRHVKEVEAQRELAEDEEVR